MALGLIDKGTSGVIVDRGRERYKKKKPLSLSSVSLRFGEFLYLECSFIPLWKVYFLIHKLFNMFLMNDGFPDHIIQIIDCCNFYYI